MFEQENSKWNLFLRILLSILIILTVAVTGTILLHLETEKMHTTMIPDATYIADEPGFTGKVNINTASKEELMMIHGIGSAKAEAILAYREQKPFTKPEDIMRVSGIGEEVYAGLADLICVE